jgi:hypothetical protein
MVISDGFAPISPPLSPVIYPPNMAPGLRKKR